METKHTAIVTKPWDYQQNDDDLIEISGEHGSYHICDIDPQFFKDTETAIAHAAYIVKAVNSHEALVKACTKLQQIHTDYIADKHGIVNVQVLLTDIQEAYEDAEQALKLAGEE